MKSPIQQALGSNWDKLPPALQAHYQSGTSTDIGYLNIEYPWFMQPVLSLFRIFGVLVNRTGRNVSTVVNKTNTQKHQHWHRTIRYHNGKKIIFKSYWIASNNNQIIEYVSPFLGLEMKVWVEKDQLHYQGVNYIFKLGNFLLPIPQWLSLGYASIVEEAIDNTQFVMDFRIAHPLFGQVFRYSGKFEADVTEGKT